MNRSNKHWLTLSNFWIARFIANLNYVHLSANVIFPADEVAREEDHWFQLNNQLLVWCYQFKRIKNKAKKGQTITKDCDDDVGGKAFMIFMSLQ